MKQNIILALIFVVLTLQVSAITTRHWSNDDESEGSASLGLWDTCLAPTGQTETCYSLPLKGDPKFPAKSLWVVRVFSLLGALLSVIALSIVALNKDKSLAISLLGLGSFLSIVASLVWWSYLNTMEGQTFNLGYSFWLNTVAGILGTVGSVSILVNIGY